MNQHPVPQNVTTYQFRLIGDMTIQQFIFLSIGVGGAIFFYYTNLFSVIKWVLVAGSAMGGFAVAFMPLEDRPLDQWIINYIRAIYRPTRFIWTKKPKTPELFSFVTNGTILPADADEISRIAAARRQQGLKSFLVTLPSENENNALEAIETNQATRILSLFSNDSPANNIAFEPTAPTISNLNIAIEAPPLNSPTAESPLLRETPGVTPGRELLQTISGVVLNTPTEIEKSNSSPTPNSPNSPNVPNISQPSSSIMTNENANKTAIAATTSASLPFPSTPTTPNTVVGMALDRDNKIVENAIIEITDEAGFPVRATRTNQLGQFFSTTPLKRGTYRINIEKVGLNFDTIEITLNGQTVEPLKIQAKA